MRARILLFPALALALGACTLKQLPERCYEEPASGRGKAAHKRFYYDTGAQVCKPFIWGGQNGNVPFDSLEGCKNSCNAPGPEQAATFKKATPSGDTEK
jgi:hypothetical protein